MASVGDQRTGHCPCLVAGVGAQRTRHCPCLVSSIPSSVPNATSLGICTSRTDARAADFFPSLWSTALILFTKVCKIFFVNYAWALILVVQITFNLFPRHICKVTTTQTGSGTSGQIAPPPPPPRALLQENERSLHLGNGIAQFFPPKSKVVYFLLFPSQTQCRFTTQPLTRHLA